MGHRVFAGAHSKVLLSEAKLGQFVVRPSPLDFTQTSGPLPASEITTSPYGSIEGSRSSTYYEGGIYNRLGVMLPETTATGGTVTLVNQDTGTVAYDDSVPDDPENPFRVRQALVKALAALRPPAPSAGTETGQRDEGLASRSKEGTARSRSRVSKARMVASTGMSKADKALIRRLEQIERKVMAHEAAHISAGGGLVGPASFSYVQGPDGQDRGGVHARRDRHQGSTRPTGRPGPCGSLPGRPAGRGLGWPDGGYGTGCCPRRSDRESGS